jgi:hypothetical protein
VKNVEVQPYKSIIRTRSQKMAEHAVYLQAMFQDIAAFYELHKREPLMTDTKEREVEMANFIKALRDAHAADCLGGQSGVDTVLKALPWFKFETRKQMKSQSTCFSTLATAFTICAYLSAFVSAVSLAELCLSRNACPSWVGDAQAVVTAAQSQLVTAFTAVTAGAF